MNKDIAIIGIAGRFGDSDNINSLYEKLKTGKNVVRNISDNRKITTSLPMNEDYFKCAYIEDIDKFDYSFFNISKAEAIMMCPTQRLLLEVIYETLNNAAYSKRFLENKKISVFCAKANSNYYKYFKKANPMLLTGGMNPFLISKITKFFKWNGPAFMVDTTCSSGLAILNLACNDLLSGNSEYSLICGVNLYLFPFKKSKENFDVWSLDGDSQSFSIESNGMSRGESVVALLLKPLDKALRDKDIIHAVVKSTVINNNADKTLSPSEPSSDAQADVIVDAWEKAKVQPEDLGFIEAHGSGTRLGDYLEIEGLNKAFSKYTNKKKICPISSIKANIGHGISTAGLNGLIKAILSLKYKTIFANKYFKEDGHYLNFEKSAVYINKKEIQWNINKNKKRLAGVTSAGISGINGHTVLQEAPIINNPKSNKDNLNLINLSAKTINSLRLNIKTLYERINNDENICINDIAYTLNVGRQHYPFRYSVICESLTDLKNRLKQAMDYKTKFGVSENIKKIVFIFSDYKNIDQKILEYYILNYDVFKEKYKDCKLNYRGKINDKFYAFSFQYAYYHLLMSYNIKTNYLLSVGWGSIICDVIAGNISLNEGINMISEIDNNTLDFSENKIKKIIDEIGDNFCFVPIGVDKVFIKNLEIKIKKYKNIDICNFYKLKNEMAMPNLVHYLYKNGVEINWENYFKKSGGRKIELPAYQFEKNRCWPKTESICPVLDIENKNSTIDIIKEIFSEILEIDLNNIYSESNFFTIGGDSLMATRVIKKINNYFNLKIHFEDIFDYPTPISLSKYLDLQINKKDIPNDLLLEIINIFKEVLMIEKLEKNDNFFKLGGHSLLATNLINKINKRFGVYINFISIFENPSPEKLTELIKKSSQNNDFHIKVAENKEYYKLSHAQQRMFVLYKLEPDSLFYNIKITRKLSGKINIEKLEEALNMLAARHEILRTNFKEINGEPVQMVNRNLELRIMNYEYQKEKTKDIIREIVQRPFKLETDNLLRAVVIKRAEGEYALIVIVHHIIWDRFSGGIFYDELIRIYDALINNKKVKLQKLDIQYKDYAEWEQSEENKKRLLNQEKYWLKELGGELPVLNLPTDKLRPAIQTYNGSVESIILDTKKLMKLRRLASDNETTLFAVLFSIYNIFLYKISGQNDLMVGTPSADRNYQEVEGNIGLFVNTLVIRSAVNGGKIFNDLLNETKNKFLEVLNNKDYPFELLVNKLNPERDMSRNPLFSVLFQIFELKEKNYLIKNRSMSNKSKLRLNDDNIAKFDLTIVANETINNELLLNCEYNTDLFERETIQKFLKIFELITNNILKDPKIKIDKLEIIDKEEKNKLVYKFNNIKKDYPRNKTIHQLFEEQVKKTPKMVAVEFKEKKLTYEELEKKVNKFANYLRNKKQVKPNEIVGVMMDRSFEMIIGILGIIKSGGAYLPIDPKTPIGRVDFMLKNSNAKLLVVDNKKKINLKFEIINIYDNKIKQEKEISCKNINKSSDLAYVIYTSGSTGEPKGVMVEHKSVMNLLTQLRDNFGYKNNTNILSRTNYSFDVSVAELLLGCLSGARQIFIENKLGASVIDLIKIIKKDKITHINFVPSLFNRFVDEVKDKKEDIRSLKYIFLAGEMINGDYINKFFALKTNIKLFNYFGPTEATVYVTGINLKPGFDNYNIIGKPIGNVQAYILNKEKQLQPMGIPGELYISGDGLARGYINDIKRMAEVFLSHPFIKGKRIYKTGDLAKMHKDGNIEILGRTDHQIKIRGYRIEPGEIETHIRKIDNIKEAVIVAREDKNDQDKYLVAYYITDNKKSFKTQKLKEYLKSMLPEYMIPVIFIHLKQLPLNQNGKIDRSNLPIPTEKDLDKNKYEDPKTDTEKKIARIWQGVLNIERIGLNDNFFQIGGHSLKAIGVLAKINRDFDIDMGFKELFQYPMLKEISKKVEEEKNKNNRVLSVIIPKTPKKKYYKLSYAQRRMFVLYKLEPFSVFYNINNIRKIEGNLDIEKFEESLNILIERHEILRTNFIEVDGEPVQIINKNFKFRILNFELNKTNNISENKNKEKEIIKAVIHKPFKLETDQLIRVAIIKEEDNSYILIVSMHHGISDEWSMDIFYKELFGVYNTLLKNNKQTDFNLPKLDIQYKDYAEWEQSEENKKRFKKQEKYWLKEFKGELPILELPTDKVRPAIQRYNGSIERIVVDKKILNKLKNIAKNNETTLFNVLFCVFNIFLYRISGQDDIVVGIPSADRNYQKIENNIGLFLNTLAIRSKLKADKNFKDLLKEKKNQFLEVLDNKDYPFELLVNNLNLERDMSRNPLFNVMFQILELKDGENNFKNDILSDIKLTSMSVGDNVAKFDITMKAVEIQKGDMVFNCEYNIDLFNKKTIQIFLNIMKVLIESVIKNSEQKINDLAVMSKKEENKIIKEFNDTKVEYSKNKTICKLFEEQVKKTPKRIAVKFEEKQLTYEELNQKANKLAHYLQDKFLNKFNTGKNKQTDHVIGIAVDRSLDLAISVLAVQKCGWACLLIDKNYPEKRIKYMLDNAEVNLLLVSNNKKTTNNKAYKNIKNIINVNDKKILNYANKNLNIEVKFTDVAFVVYTSGSTGKPKGVTIMHKGVINHALTKIKVVNINRRDVLSVNLSVGFVAFIWQLITPIIIGAKAEIYSEGVFNDAVGLIKNSVNDKVTILEISPSLFLTYLNNSERDYLKMSKFRKIILTGEKIPVELVNIYYKKYTIPLINAYGQAECSDDTLHYAILKNENMTIVPGGKPSNNTQVYILDKNKNIQPIGIPGELYISGDGLSCGYINDPERTREVFLDHPFRKNEKIYKTGDLARMREDGNIEILGRVDNQIKIRGNRVEPGEIEVNIKKYKGIKDCVVIAKDNMNFKEKQNKFLVAYYITENKKKKDISKIKERLKEELPRYMIPDIFVHLKEFPLNQNGKLDKLNLPESKEKDVDKNKYQEPKTETEIQIAKTWEEVLNIKKIGLNDDFFDLGGHSLRAIQVIAKINKEFNIDISLKELFKFPVLKDFVSFIDDILFLLNINIK